MADTSNPNIASAADELVDRLPVHTFTIPESSRELPADPSTISLRQLTLGEEQQAMKAAEHRGVPFAYEGAMRALVAADGKELSWRDDQKPRFFGDVSDKVRELIIRGFNKVCMPTVKESADFLASEKISVK
jgi:hypothetical protein